MEGDAWALGSEKLSLPSVSLSATELRTGWLKNRPEAHFVIVNFQVLKNCNRIFQLKLTKMLPEPLSTNTQSYRHPLLYLYPQISIFSFGLKTISVGEKCFWVRMAYALSQSHERVSLKHHMLHLSLFPLIQQHIFPEPSYLEMLTRAQKNGKPNLLDFPVPIRVKFESIS